VVEQEKPRGRLRRLFPWFAVIIVAIAIYDGSIFYSRWRRNQDSEREQIHARANKEAEQAGKTFEMLGGSELHIINFYTSAGVVRPGMHATICYGVVGARKVRIEPPVEAVWPALSHCFEVAPQKNTEYKLIAEDAAGHSVSQSLILRVAP
jgi:hypothetical protein